MDIAIILHTTIIQGLMTYSIKSVLSALLYATLLISGSKNL